MSRPNPILLAAFLIAVVTFTCGLAMQRGGIYVSTFEGDAIHMADILLRMAEGERPHVDFMTPLGALSFWPIAAFLQAGQGLGMSYIYAQTAVALVLLPAVWWAAWTRMPRRTGYAFGGVTLLIATAMMYGQTDTVISIAMHYNRWAWAVAFVILALAILPRRGAPHPVVDGVLIGVGVALLAMIKATYAVMLAPVLLVALVLSRESRTLLWAVIGGAVFGLAAFVAAGPDLWIAYVGDLIAVWNSEARDDPGGPLPRIVLGPAYLPATLLMLYAAFTVRQSGNMAAGWSLLLLIPAFIYITYQNFGNDPLWLAFIATALMAWRPEEPEDTREIRTDQRLFVTSIVAGALILPVLVNLTVSPVRHFAILDDVSSPIIPDLPVAADFQVLERRANSYTAFFAPRDGDYAPLTELEGVENEPVLFNGDVFTECRSQSGFVAKMDLVAADLADLTEPVLVADVLTGYWMFSDLPRLPGAAPWNYGDLDGLEAAGFVLVPLCPASVNVRKVILENLAEDTDFGFEKVRETGLYRLYRIDRPAAAPAEG